ncbi:hypothetical protein SAMN04488102_11711 [Alkalibacterium subtropicum]|uniref:Uncharacterized protein n=1 Tax=Alkalibacterium subtropicum TaxID=753702 RepID=A0A1I1L147_9LACT|nr:hypothetical protein [Alkalibacterium subtropicum]SFC66711.1 hypothetical protein SAMN04488102_11711 [Alkalibacterium subtropicum]
MRTIKQILLSTPMILVMLTVGYSSNNDSVEAAYKQLSSSEKAEVVDPEKATIKKVKPSALNKDGVMEYYLSDMVLESEEELYLVIFESENKDIVGNVEKLVNADDYNIVGFNLRD